MLKLQDIEKEVKSRVEKALDSLTVNITKEISIEGPVSGESHVCRLSEVLNDSQRARTLREIVEFENGSQHLKTKVA